MSDVITIINNSPIPFMIDDLGLLIVSAEDISHSVEHQELCESKALLNAIQNGILSLKINDIILDIPQSKKFLKIESVLEDSANEQWRYNFDAVINPFTQLHIIGRPIELDENVDLILEEGADLIIE